MSSETLEELKAIRDGAPKGYELVCLSGETFYKFEDNSWVGFSHEGFEFVEYEIPATRLLSDINSRIKLMEVESDIRAALKAANIQNRKLLDKTENLKEKIKDIGYSYRRVEQERDELRILKFKKFNEEECWLYQGDGNDYLESLVCPVVISPEKLIDIINGDL
ncbi:hypothetical protein FQP85_22170 [Pseudoalteromonas neustonica]|uniref:Uncharacterized protein n=1 Tax=Pseudoalteromonas neustonica TaxID=1840331 RepID=A0ABY3F7F7_9GAMM|nr:hypothetical protein [Pseudoalteromonas neustonica]TVU79900.1 hypothetical protein FQP85_22170 [Pseudoalteromonas neustonica]